MNYKSIINPKYASLAKFVNELPQRFDKEGMLIYDSRNQVRVFKVDGEKIVVKRFHRPLFTQRFDYTFVRPSKEPIPMPRNFGNCTSILLNPSPA